MNRIIIKYKYMNRIIVKYKYLMLLTGILTFASCGKETEPDPFTGKDSYITTFSLKQGETTFNAAITGDEITVTVPEGFSLNQAKATVILSENATIYPDPSTVADWDEERRFAVTAYNSGQLTYIYKVKRSGIAYDGTIVLETQADVDAFGQQRVTFIGGSLTIGRTTGADSVTSLAPLAGLKEVAYNLTINPTFAGTGLEGLESLEHAGTLQIGAVKHLEILRLPALKTAGNFNLQNTVTFIVELPELAEVTKQFRLYCPLYQLQLPNLQSAGSLTLTAASNASASLAKVDLPKLEKTDGILEISFLHSLTRIDLPALKKTGGLTFSSMNMLSFVYAPQIEEVTGAVNVAGVPALTEFGLPKLKRQTGGAFTLAGAALKVLDFTNLTEVAGTLTLSGAALSMAKFPELQTVDALTLSGVSLNVAEFPKLQTVAGTLTLSSAALNSTEFPRLTEVAALSISAASANVLDGFTALQTAGTVTLSNLQNAVKLELPANIRHVDMFTVDVTSNTPPEEINVAGKSIGILSIRSNALLAGKLVGDEVFHGALVIYALDGTASSILPRRVEGFREVDSLNISSGNIDTVTLSGIRKINGGAAFRSGYGGYPRQVSLLDLEEVNGNLNFDYSDMSYSTATDFEVKSLKRVGGNFIMNMMTNSVKNLSFPELTAVEGDFNLTAGYDYSSYGYVGFETVNFPKLAAIDGKLTIHSGYASVYNRNLKNLDGFAALTGVKAISVMRLQAIESYEGLKEAFKSLASPDDWSATGNGYNPTYQDLANGKWTK
jgi:hypothetical protein